MTPLEIQAWTPPAGRVEVTMCPALSPATHSDTEGHEIAVRLLMPAAWIRLACQAEGPRAGRLETTAYRGLTATHKAAEVQEIAPRSYECAGWTARQAEAPPVGRVETSIFPRRGSIATHSDLEGHESACSHDW